MDNILEDNIRYFRFIVTRIPRPYFATLLLDCPTILWKEEKGQHQEWWPKMSKQTAVKYWFTCHLFLSPRQRTV
jgi:hypothetical protein